MSRLSSEKLNLTQQKHNKNTTTHNKHRFGRLLRAPAWKLNGSILEEVGKQGSK